MFNRVWKLFNDQIVDHVLSETRGTAIIELTTSLKDTMKMLENPKQVIEEEMERKGSNLSKTMLDAKIVQLLPELESKTREFPNDSILKMFYELLQQGWKRHLQIITNHTSFAASVLYWSMSVDEERDSGAFEKYINKLTIRTCFATLLWRKQPHWIRDNRENNETMILFYWYNKSAIDLDYSERYHKSHMSLLDRSLYIKTKNKLNDILIQRKQIIDWYNSVYTKIRLDTQLMIRGEQNWAQQEMKLYKDPNQVITDLYKVQSEFKMIEELTRTQYKEIEAENVSRNFKLPLQKPPNENEQWRVLIIEHLQEVRQQIIVYIDELTEQQTEPEYIVQRVIEMVSGDYIPQLKQSLKEQKDQINELANEHKYDYDINNEPDKFVRIKKYSNDILMSLFFHARHNQLSQLNNHINDVLHTLQTSLPPNHELVSSFYVYIKSHLADSISNYTKDYGILNTFLKEKSDVALEIRDLEYMIEAYNALINWASSVLNQTTVEDIIVALNMTTVNDTMDTFQRQEYQLATIKNEEETYRQDIKFIKKFDLLSYMNLFSDSIEAFNNQAIKILVQEQQSLIKKSNVRSLYTAKMIQSLDTIATSSSSNGWQLTHINTVDNDDRAKLISLIQSEILSKPQPQIPAISASYHLLQQFTFADQSLARATLDEIWQCILAIWKIIIVTNPTEINL